jgi:hypothetical protein
MLDKQQLAFAQKMVGNAPDGDYTLRELFGDEWTHVHRPRAYGKWFKASVTDQQLPSVTWIGRRSNRALVYSVRHQRS